MSAAKAAGRLPWTGSAQRTSDIGYGEAMGDIAYLVEGLLRGVHGDPGAEPLLPAEALEAIRSYCFDVYAMHCEARMTLLNIGWCAGLRFRQTWRQMYGHGGAS